MHTHSRTLSRSIVALVAFSALAASAAQAFELKRTTDGYPVHWGAFPVAFGMDAQGPRDLGMEAAEQAIRAAFLAWQRAPGTTVAFIYEGRLRNPGVGYDRDAAANQNAVVFGGEAWDFEPEALAVTLTLFKRGSGELVDADIVVNEKFYDWGVGAAVDNDLQNALTHEVGHLLGLAHSEANDATMYASASPHETEKRTLDRDDVAALQALYPGDLTDDPAAEPVAAAGRDDQVEAPGDEDTDAPLDTVAPGALSCSAAPGAGDGGLFGVLLLLGTAVLRRARR